MKIVGIMLAAGLSGLTAMAPAPVFADDPGTSLCPEPTSNGEPVFIAFDQSRSLYTLDVTSDPNGGPDVATRREVGRTEVATICALGFDVRALPDATTQGDYFPAAIEFHHAGLDHYFVTSDANEIRDLDTGVHPGWKRTGQQFRAYVQDPTTPSGESPLAPVCRYYGRPEFGPNTHFYSAFTDECDAVAVNWPDRWALETEDAFGVHLPDVKDGICPQDTSPVYRLFNNRSDANHRYTTLLSIRAQMLGQGWVPEGFGPLGVAMCVRPL